MKKLIALLLALLMAFSAVITVSAEGTGAETPEAPKNILAQTRANKDENEKIVSYDVRFLATVHSTVGKEIGFEVVATFLNKNGDTLETKEVTYSKKKNEKEDANMAGTTVYTTVTAAGEEYTVADLTENDTTAVGVFAAVIAGVPANLDVVFKIKTYVDYEGGTNESSVVTAQYIDGVIVNMTGTQSVYSQDFTTAKTSAEALEAAGITKPYGQAMNPTFEGDRLNIPYTKWGTGPNCFFGLIPRAPFTEMYTRETDDINDDGVYNYMLEMNLDITQLHALSFIFNGSPDSESDTNKYRPDSIYVSLRVPTADDASKFQKGLISDLAASGENILVRTSQYTTEGKDANNFKDIKDAYEIADDAKNVALKLTIVVNNTYTDAKGNAGCQVGVFINGNYVQSFEVADTYRVKANSYVSVWAEESVLSIDNVKVSKINGAITLDTANESGTLPTPENPKYNQTFDDIDPLEACNVTFPYKYQGVFSSNTCSGGFPVTINADGQLQVNKHAWHNNADYFAHLVSADEVDAAGVYKFEADLDITTLSAFGFTINNDVDETLKNKNGYSDNVVNQKNMLFVSFRSLAADKSTTGKAGLHFRIAHYDKNGNQAGSQDFYIGESATALKAKFTMIVDSTYVDEEGNAKCKLYLFLDNKLITTVVYDETYDVKTASSIGIWAQDTAVTIDNIKFTGVKKN